jgi:hypothetical protein
MPSRSLLVLCGLSAASVAGASQAAMIGDDSFRLNLSADAQTRAEHASADAPTGGGWDTVLARPGSSDQLDFSIPRARVGLNGSYGAGYRFDLSLRAVDVDTAGNGASRGIELYKAWVEREIGDATAHSILHLGLDQPFFNRSQSIYQYWLFPQQRATGAMLEPRGVGVRYLLAGQAFDFGFDVMNNLDAAKPAANADKSDGLFYSARLELSALDGPKPAYRESYAGDQGEGLLLALDVGYDAADYGTPGVKTDSLCYGIEAVGHFDQLSCLAELRFQHDRTSSFTAAPSGSRDARIFLAQFGYAMLIGRGVALEPAIRLELIDLDTANSSEAVPYDGGPHVPGPDSDWGDSGRQIDIGLNLYLARHSNKLQFSYSHWDAESGSGGADIIRLQHQVYF